MKSKLTLAATTLLATFAAWAYEYTWTGSAGTADWATSDNWSPSDGGTSYPSSGDTAIVPAAGATVKLDDSGATIAKLTLNGDLTLTCSTVSDNGSGDLHVGEVDGTGKIILKNGSIANIRGTTLTLTNNVVVADGTDNNRMSGYESPIEFSGSLSGSGTVTFHGWWSNGGVKISGDNSGFTGVGIVDSDGNNNTCFYAPCAMSASADWIFQGTTKKNRIFFDDQGSDAANTVYLGSLTATDLRSDGAYVRVNIDKDGRTTGIDRFKTILEIGGNNHDSQFLQTMGDATYGVQTPVCLRKVGDGTLTIYEPRHSYGTEINGGTLEVTSTNSIRSLTDNVITFGGGTLKYGTMTKSSTNTDLDTPVPVTTDWSSRIGFAANTADISVETTGADVSWATPIPATHAHGLVKKGTGTLEVQGYSAYTGKTTVSGGALKVGFQYTSANGISREWEVADGASLEVELHSSGTYFHAAESALLTGIPNGSIVNLSNADYRAIPRFGDVTTFTGTVNFCNSLDNSGDNGAGGLVGSSSTLGSNGIDWGVVGEPDSANTRVFNIEGSGNGNVANFGALRLTSTNAMIYAKYSSTLNIGALGKESVLNGKLEMNGSSNLTVNSTDGTLTLGEDFGVVANGGAEYTGTATFNITGGTFVNNVDLSAYTVNIGSGVTLGGTSTFGDVDLSDNDVVVPDATTITDKTADYRILTATSFTNVESSSNLKTLLATLNENETKGSWKARKVNNGDGTQSLVLRFVKKGFVIIFK